MPWIIILTLEIMWYRAWKGTCIFGIRNLTEIQWEWENAKYLDQKQNLTARRSKIYKYIIWAYDVGVFCPSIGNLGAKKVSRKIQKGGRRYPLHSPSSFLPLFPLCFNILRYQKGCLIFACVNTKYKWYGLIYILNLLTFATIFSLVLTNVPWKRKTAL